MLTDATLPPPDQDQVDEQRRQRVLQALMAQQTKGNGGWQGALSTLANAYASKAMRQNAAEDGTNTRLGMTRVYPALDDNGNPMPRGAGMKRANPLDAITNFFANGGQ